MLKIVCPSYTETALKLLKNAGYDAYIVGGCVRDFIMGRKANDWDMTSSSSPSQTMEVFKDFRTVPTGIKHGTVTVIIEDRPVEITTMRIDGEYLDSRHPESVMFTDNITEDLSRRDFTVNAMAYNHEKGLIDPFGGREDIEKRIIRCVGNPDIRFSEDALRIIRALRFASVLKFSIDKDTSLGIRNELHLLRDVSRERVRDELIKLLQGSGVEEILTDFKEVFFDIIPELRQLDGFKQETPYHMYDVWTHTIKVVSHVKNTKELRVAALLHDIGKPACYKKDADGIAHFKGHAPFGARMAQDILKNLRFSNNDIRTICTLIKIHDERPDGTDRQLLNLCSEYSPQIVFLALELMKGDAAGKNKEYAYSYIADYEKAQEQLERITARPHCFKIKDLEIDGNDIIREGFFGKDVGKILNELLSKVISGEINNTRKDLTEEIRKIK